MQQNSEKEMCAYHFEYKQELWKGEGLYCESCLLESAREADEDCAQENCCRECE